jgi:hypothetical protein
MKIYEFITPSDPVTFKAEDDKIAYTCALLLGNGKAACVTHDEKGNEVSLPTLLMFSENVDEEIEEYIGGKLDDFIKQNKDKISEVFSTFMYGKVSDRRTYDVAIDAITDPDKLTEFKKIHEDKNRTSMNEWVKTAWIYAEKVKNL